MTDLENLWDDLPVAPAPTAQILRAARAASRPRRSRRRLLRPLSSVAALAAIGGAFVVGTYVSGPPANPPAATPPGDDGADGSDAAAFHGELMAGESCDALLDYYVERGVALVGPYGWGSPHYGLRDGIVLEMAQRGPTNRSTNFLETAAGAVDQLSSAYSAADAPVSQRVESSDTGTNVQEQNVDEPDVVKTDGERLFRIEDGTLSAYDVSGTETERLSDLDLGDLEDAEILLADDAVVAIGNDGSQDKRMRSYYKAPSPMTRVVSVDVSDPAKPEVTSTVDFDSSLVSARQHGDAVRLIASAGLPDLDFVMPGNTRRGGLHWKDALRRNEELVRTTTISDWLPTGSVDGGTDKRLAECEDVAVPKADLGLDTMSVVGFDAADPTSWDVTALAASAPLAYASADHLYLGASPTSWGGCFDLCPLASPTTTTNEEAGTTHLFDFELTATGTSYVGAGEVDGMIRDRWAMDEYDDTLRLAVSPTERTGNFNSIVTMQRVGDELAEVGRLDKLGVNEDIQSVRWLDGLAIVVTFRQIDPLYTLDLTDPAAPQLLGELKIPGFSSYLHPVGPRRLIGIGQGPTGVRGGWGAQAGLFKVTDLTDPRRKAVVSYANGTEARAGTDPRQFTWLPSERTALTVISKGWRGRTGWVSVLSLKDGAMTNRMVEAEYGDEIADVRLVPLPDGRVVLSTGDDAGFFDIDGR
ncbi:MAG: beta-propeller domain-containing protein [Actinomycetota bacterium]|nr:beta-propeller domain-containing protein [Actinomycetota bacterium]